MENCAFKKLENWSSKFDYYVVDNNIILILTLIILLNCNLLNTFQIFSNDSYVYTLWFYKSWAYEIPTKYTLKQITL